MKDLKRTIWIAFMIVFAFAISVWGVACAETSDSLQEASDSSFISESALSDLLATDTENEQSSISESLQSSSENVEISSETESISESESQVSLESSLESVESSIEESFEKESSSEISSDTISSEDSSESSLEIDGSSAPLVHEHIWDAGTIIKYATCVEAGEKSFVCTFEGCTESKIEETNETEKENGHLYETIEGKAATCTETGLTDGTQCSRCKDWSKKQEITAITPHNYVENVCKDCQLAQLKYQIGQGKAVCVGFVSEEMVAETVVIADVYCGLPVVSIKESAFANCWFIYRVTLSENLTEIENLAFKNCYNITEIYNNSTIQLTKGTVLNGQIARYAKSIYTSPQESKVSTDANGFTTYIDGINKILIAYTGKERSIEIPDGVTEISSYAFNTAHNLEEITMADSVAKICEFAFAECSALVRVEFGKGVREIYAYAFYNTDIKKIAFKIKDSWWKINPGEIFDPNGDNERVEISDSETQTAEYFTFKGTEDGNGSCYDKYYYRT